ncbi:Cdc6/Cdc18 family protein [Halostella litorea]|uniref:Cdc6/Cdc18 family protein n=1 Tax=Halostella litorea TaxID=2528831 RepID=UPI0010918A5E|nr:Cdc6/Cdc18 family protein [Halostella litorea]
MIQDARVLQQEFIPKEIEHRHAEMNRLSDALRPILDGQQPDNVFIFGPTGAGKTCVARYSLEKLREELLDIQYQYINCWQDYNRFRVLYRMLEGIDSTLDIHRQSTPRDELFERLREYDDMPYVVILDEVDQLEDMDVLYDLYTLRNITMIMIANEELELFAGMDQRVNSRLQSSHRLQFDAYSNDELVGILSDRVEWGFTHDAISTRQLETIADAAAGDARVAIGILRSAARQAEQDGADSIADTTITQAIPAARSELHQQNIEKLNEHQQTVYDIVADAEVITPGELYDRYEGAVSDPKTKRTVRNYLQKMVHYDLIESEGEKRGREYRLNTQ